MIRVHRMRVKAGAFRLSFRCVGETMQEPRIARTDEEIIRCFPAMAELRPHLDLEEFVERIRRQCRGSGYTLAFVKREAEREAENEAPVVAVAGYRISECLAWGKFLYVDDLVSLSDLRSQGYGGILFDWLVERARVEGCGELHLDSGVQRFGAHRFYLRRRMDITSHHFAMRL